jgi:hypothetical protein
MEVRHDLSAGAAEIKSIEVSNPQICDLDILFLDTPGFDDDRTDKDVAEMVIKWLNTT